MAREGLLDISTRIARLTKQPKLLPDIFSKSVPFVPAVGTQQKWQTNPVNLTFFERCFGDVCFPHCLVQMGQIYWKCLLQGGYRDSLLGTVRESPTIWYQRGTKLSAIDVIAKAFFERLYLVLGLSPFEPRVNCPYTPTAHSKVISRFLCNFFSTWPLIFCQHTIHQVIWHCPGTLVTSFGFLVNRAVLVLISNNTFRVP